jgi:hypothetical protein
MTDEIYTPPVRGSFCTVRPLAQGHDSNLPQAAKQPPNALTPSDKATLAETAEKWRCLGWFQFALVPVLAWFGAEGWPWQLLVPAFIFWVVSDVPSGSRFAVTSLFLFAVLALLGMIVGIFHEGSVSSYHLYHIREFAAVYVVETSWASMVAVWRRKKPQARKHLDEMIEKAETQNPEGDWSSPEGDWSSEPAPAKIDFSNELDFSKEPAVKNVAKELIARYGIKK